MYDETGEEETLFIGLKLSAEELAAIDGWQVANRLPTREAAMRELVRLGLLAEIGRVYQGTQKPG